MEKKRHNLADECNRVGVVVGDDNITFGERDEKGRIIFEFYELSKQQVDTEQKVLAWVNHLSEKRWMNLKALRDFIIGCSELNPQLRIYPTQ